jgi:itaconate CoA-transferase
VSVTGTPDEPSKAGPSIADIAAGMYAYTNILAALLQRGLDGPGPAHRHLDAGSADRVDELPAVLRLRRRSRRPRAPVRHATIYPYGPFPAGDGKTVMLGLQNEREWQAFCDKVLLQPGAGHRRALCRQRRSAWPRDALRAIIVDAFAPLTAAQVAAAAGRRQIANAQVNTMAEVWAHPQLAARQRWRTGGHPGRPGAGAAAAGQLAR